MGGYQEMPSKRGVVDMQIYVPTFSTDNNGVIRPPPHSLYRGELFLQIEISHVKVNFSDKKVTSLSFLSFSCVCGVS